MNQPPDPPDALSDDALDALLTTHGGPAGPQLDRLWAHVEDTLDPPDDTDVVDDDRPARRWPAWTALGTAMAAACAALLFVTSSPRDEFAIKGGASDDAAVFVQLSCAPCVVDQPMFVRLRVRQPGEYRVKLQDAQGQREVWRSTGALAVGETAVPLAFRFDAQDAATAAVIVVDAHDVVVAQRKVPLP